MNRHKSSPGGRRGAHRVVCTLAGLLLISPSNALRANGSQQPDISVREQQGIYRVEATFHVPEPLPVALAVLTDYEQIPRFMPAVKTSVVRDRLADGSVLVEQEAVARLMMFSKRVHLMLEVSTEGHTVRFRDACGRSFHTYQGIWRMERTDGSTVITYELTARPSFSVPEFLLTRLLERDAKQMIDRLRGEIAARGRNQASQFSASEPQRVADHRHR